MLTSKKTKIERSLKNIQLSSFRKLHIDEVSVTYETVHELHPDTKCPIKQIEKKAISETVNPLDFKLEPVTKAELTQIRRDTKTPGFVLKIDGQLLYTKIPGTLNFIGSNLLDKPHLCNDCGCMSALPDEEGGCAKVRNRACNKIERYDFIQTGYEVFNTSHNSFVVVECMNHNNPKPKERISTTTLNAMRLSLAQFVWEDVETREQVKARVEKNHAKNTGASSIKLI